jgi:hypothetical protein
MRIRFYDVVISVLATPFLAVLWLVTVFASLFIPAPNEFDSKTHQSV